MSLGGPSSHAALPNPSDHNAAREYESIQNRLFVVRWALTLVIAVIYLYSGLSVQLADGLRSAFDNPWVVNALYILITVFGFAAMLFPIALYEEYVIERAFGRSDQTLGEWFRYYLKGLALELILAAVFFEVLYALLRYMPRVWWVWTALFYIAAGVVFTTLAPVLILPLLFKTKPILEASWLPQVRRLLQSIGLPEVNLFEWTFSDRTHAENVVLAGLGKTRRILISDTVLQNHTDDEIVALVAHELGHYSRGDLWRNIALEGAVALGGFYVAHEVLNRFTPRFGFSTPADIAAFPVLVVSLFVVSLIVMPAINTMSRHNEYAADALAVRWVGSAAPLISAIQKANARNLSDPHPHPILEALLHSHPSTDRRIAHARRVEDSLKEQAK